MEVIPVGKDSFTLKKYCLLRSPKRISIIEVQAKDDGCINDTPSFMAVMKDENTDVYFTEFSLETLQAILSKMGYRAVKKKES